MHARVRQELIFDIARHKPIDAKIYATLSTPFTSDMRCVYCYSRLEYLHVVGAGLDLTYLT